MRFGIIPTSPAEAKLSELRLTICEKCIYAKPKQLIKILNGNVSNVAELQCTGGCGGCPCLEKSLVVDEACPKNKW